MIDNYIKEAQQTLSLHPDYNKYKEHSLCYHSHSNLSVRDGASNIENLVKSVSEKGYKKFILTDHGTIAGIYDSFKFAEKHDIKAGIGCEFYMVMSNEMEQRNKYHITAIALNDQGYQDMLKLQYLSCLKSGEGQIDGLDGAFYFVPRVTEKYLSHFSNNIMISSGCRLSIINRAFIENDFVRAYSILEYFRTNLKYFFIELHIANSDVEERLFWLLKRYAQQNDISTIIANDSHYVEKNDHISWQLLNAIRHSNSIKDNNIPNADFYIKTYDELISDTFRCNVKSYYYEIAHLLRQIQEFFVLGCYSILLNIFIQIMANMSLCLENQDDIFSDTIELFYGFKKLNEIESFNWYGDWKKRNLPMLVYPDADVKLKKVLHEKLLQKFNNKIPNTYIERMKKEWKALQETNNVSYLYVNYLFLEECKRKDIMLSSGRGSAAGLLSAYLIGATRVDPIPYNLVMERAMNPDRPKLMDIDLDFATTESKDAIKILKEMFGDDHVCQIINYGYTKVKQAIQSVGRYLKLPPYEMDNLTKQLNIFEEEDEDEESEDIIRRKATPSEQLILLKESQYIENLNKFPLQYIIGDELIKINGDKFCEYVERLIGTINNLSVHASGVLVMNEPVWKYVPVMRVGDTLVSAFDMRILEDLHGLKIDVLKVAVMDLIRDGYNYLYDKELLIR